MTTFFVHRRADGIIASAHEEMQPGYAEEIVDLAAPGMEIFRPPSAYIALRRAAYPPLTDYVDAVVHRESGDPQPYADYVAACLAVKAKYPKTAK